MLLGRQFQNKTYDTLSFDRDYKSFFPISVMAKRNGIETSIPVSDIKVSDRIIIRNEELIPADSILIKGDASIDYSFVTGKALLSIKSRRSAICRWETKRFSYRNGSCKASRAKLSDTTLEQ